MKDLSAKKNHELRDIFVLGLLFILFFGLGLGCGLCLANYLLDVSLIVG